MFVKDLILDILKKYDKKASNKVLKTIEEVEANTDSNNIAGADVTAEIISNLSADGVPFRFGVDSDGNYGYILQDGEGGADTVHPFSSNYKVTINYTVSLSHNIAGYSKSKSGSFVFYIVDGHYERLNATSASTDSSGPVNSATTSASFKIKSIVIERY